tara:strand:- start:440 stop:1180 length:741 start_codon:yes stop_codon:yes gene_type:complete
MSSSHNIPSGHLTAKTQLAQAYQIIAMLNLDDHTYTHLSHRACEQTFFLQPFGLKFSEITAEKLLTVSFDGKILEGTEAIYNPTGYQTHGAIYQARPDIQAIFHLHTPNIVAVSALECGLLPISQWALHFYDQIHYHDYDALVTSASQGEQLAQDLGDKFILLMRNHGVLITGRTIQEAMFYTHHLELACKTQCLALSMQQPLITPSQHTCEKSVNTLLNFEKDLGKRDWQAWVRQLEKQTNKSSI